MIKSIFLYMPNFIVIANDLIKWYKTMLSDKDLISMISASDANFLDDIGKLIHKNQEIVNMNINQDSEVPIQNIREGEKEEEQRDMEKRPKLMHQSVGGIDVFYTL